MPKPHIDVKVHKFMMDELDEVFAYMAESRKLEENSRLTLRRVKQIAYRDPEQELQELVSRYRAANTEQAVANLEK